jgi:hypothetical protein
MKLQESLVVPFQWVPAPLLVRFHTVRLKMLRRLAVVPQAWTHANVVHGCNIDVRIDDMAVNETRSMNADLREGLTDGRIKKVAPNRGGFPNDAHLAGAELGRLGFDLYDPSFYGNTSPSQRQTELHG